MTLRVASADIPGDLIPRRPEGASKGDAGAPAPGELQGAALRRALRGSSLRLPRYRIRPVEGVHRMASASVAFVGAPMIFRAASADTQGSLIPMRPEGTSKDKAGALEMEQRKEQRWSTPFEAPTFGLRTSGYGPSEDAAPPPDPANSG